MLFEVPHPVKLSVNATATKIVLNLYFILKIPPCIDGSIIPSKISENL